jgi:alpha-L-arabinofuranosidase
LGDSYILRPGISASGNPPVGDQSEQDATSLPLAQVKTISAPSIDTENNEMQPSAVETVTNQIQVGSHFEMVFPHTSVVVIRLLRKSN